MIDVIVLTLLQTDYFGNTIFITRLRREVLPEPHDGRVAELILQLIVVMAPASNVSILLPVNIRPFRLKFFEFSFLGFLQTNTYFKLIQFEKSLPIFIP